MLELNQTSLSILRSLKSVKAKKFAPIIFVSLLGLICTFNIVLNKRGLIVLFELNALLPKMSENLDILRAERLKLENQAELLRESSLDIDMLDEKARKILDFAKTKELILIPKHDDN